MLRISSQWCHENSSNMSKDLFKGIIKRRSGTDQRVCVDNWDQTYGAIATLIDSGLTAISVPFIVIRTHENDAEYACSKSALSVQANARSCKHIHARTHTSTHPYALLPYLHDVELMLQIDVYASSKCMQRYIFTRFRVFTHKTKWSMHAPNLRFRFKQMPQMHTHRHTQTLTLVHTHTHVCC